MHKKQWINFLLLGSYLIVCFLIYQDNPYEEIKKKKITADSSSYIVPSQNREKRNIEQQSGNNIENKSVQVETEESLATLYIPKIKLERKIYPLDDERNNVEQNVTLLRGSTLPEEEESIIFLAAHSGTGKKALFHQLDELKKGDPIFLEYNGTILSYQVEKMEEQEKDGDIQVSKKSGRELILTTCSQKDKTKQLVISCIEKN